jgi:hypothetical protein
MARGSPITIGASVLMTSLLGAAAYTAYMVWHSRHHADTIMVSSPRDEWGAPAAPTHQRASPSGASRERMQARSPAALGVPIQIPLPEPAATADPRLSVTLHEQVFLGVANRQQRVQEMDEWVFEVMRLPEAQQVAIRKINEDLGSDIRGLLDTAPSDLSAELVAGSHTQDSEADRTRRAALENLLGVSAAGAFETNERAAARLMLHRHRRQWARELQGLPPRPL